MATRTQAARLLVYDAARAYDEGRDRPTSPGWRPWPSSTPPRRRSSSSMPRSRSSAPGRSSPATPSSTSTGRCGPPHLRGHLGDPAHDHRPGPAPAGPSRGVDDRPHRRGSRARPRRGAVQSGGEPSGVESTCDRYRRRGPRRAGQRHPSMAPARADGAEPTPRPTGGRHRPRPGRVRRRRPGRRRGAPPPCRWWPSSPATSGRPGSNRSRPASSPPARASSTAGARHRPSRPPLPRPSPRPARPTPWPMAPTPAMKATSGVPDGAGPHPVAVLFHGGFWYHAWERDLMDGLALDLARRGIAAWNVEYRRVGAGGGWPATGEDAARAADHLLALAPVYELDLGRVAVLGHSAGAQLALWVAARGRRGEVHPASSSAWRRSPISKRPGTAGIGGDSVARLLTVARRRRRRPGPRCPPRRGVAESPASDRGSADPGPRRRRRRRAASQTTAYAEAARAAGDDVTVLDYRGGGPFRSDRPRHGLAWSPVAGRHGQGRALEMPLISSCHSAIYWMNGAGTDASELRVEFVRVCLRAARSRVAHCVPFCTRLPGLFRTVFTRILLCSKSRICEK